MNAIAPAHTTDEGAQYRTMLRDSVRRLLGDKWRPDDQGEGDVVAIWQDLHDQGLSELGQSGQMEDLREILLVMEELGRAACPAPLLAAILANVALRENSPAAAGMPLAFSFGGFEGDREEGSARFDNGCVSGDLRFVEGMAIAKTLLLFAQGPLLCQLSVDEARVTVSPTIGLARPSLADVSLREASAVCTPFDVDRLADLHRLARLCLSARALGAAMRGFELVVEYARERRQFGQPIGQFQAIQHKLVNSHMVLEAARLQLDGAVAARIDNSAGWPLRCASAVAFCAQTLRQVALETQHVFGAIGFAEEHEAPKLFRQIHSDVVRLGGVRGAREEIAELIFDGEEDAFAAADAGEGDQAGSIRAEIREWLASNWTDEDRAESRRLSYSERKWNLPFAERLGAGGWTTLSWPDAAGGQNRSPIEQVAYAEELLRAGASDAPVSCACRILAPEIIAHATPELRDSLLPRIRAGKASVALGYSEPEAGSDLASLRTRAEFDGTHYVVNGQKIWTTEGHRATHMILAARTNPDPKARHAGISLFVLPMNSPGLSVRPTMAMYGDYFCNVFFDDVRIPAANLLGPLNGGWKILANALASERVAFGVFATQVGDLLQRIVGELKARGMASDPVVRDRIAALVPEVQAARELSLRSILLSGGDYTPLVEAAMGKVYSSELSQRLTETAMDIFGTIATLGEDAPGVPIEGAVEQMRRYSMVLVIAGGTNEIQRNVIAQRGLGLPVQR